MNFSLWHDSWIDVIGADGMLGRVSIADCLTQAHQLRAIAAPSPLSSIGIQRLLIAIVQDIVRPASVDDVARLLVAGAFGQNLIDAFAAAHAARFGLFDEEAPFLQRPGPCEAITKGERKSAAALFVEVASASRRAWWTRHFEDMFVVCPACAAAGMLAFPAAATAFGPGIRATLTGAGVRYVLPSGPTLFDALARAVLAPGYQSPSAHGDPTSAPWTWPPDAISASPRKAVGYLESLVFPSRTMRLIPKVCPITCSRCGVYSRVAVAEALLGSGWYFEGTWIDPFLAYYRTKQERLVPVLASGRMTAWRALAPLIAKAPIGSQRPLVVDQLAELQRRGAIPGQALLTFRCVGLDVIEKASYRSWVDDTLAIPPAVLHDETLGAGLLDAVSRAQLAVCAVEAALASDGLVSKSVVDTTVRQLWNELAGPFHQLVATITQETADTAFDAWSWAVLDAARTCGEAALQTRAGAGALRVAQARQRLGRTLGGMRKQWSLPTQEMP